MNNHYRIPVHDKAFGNKHILQVMGIMRRDAEKFLTVALIAVWDLCVYIVHE